MANNINIYVGDILKEDKEYILNACEFIGIDTETTGLNPLEDKLCTIQISADEKKYIIKYSHKITPHNFIEILSNENVCKVFHHANFDIRFIMKHLNLMDIKNVVCTKIAAKILYGDKGKNSLKDLLYEHLNIIINKEQQLSDWSKQDLTLEQIEYASNDVKYLVELWTVLRKEMLDKGLLVYAQKCYEFLPTQAYLQNIGIQNIFNY